LLILQKVISIGSLNAAIVYPREVFRAVIKRCSASIICAHVRPSGDPTPSQEDVELTYPEVLPCEFCWLVFFVHDHEKIGSVDIVVYAVLVCGAEDDRDDAGSFTYVHVGSPELSSPLRATNNRSFILSMSDTMQDFVIICRNTL
jgi:hypothetical protein